MADRIPLRLSGITGGGAKQMLETVAQHMFTAADGETYAVGRLLGVLLLLFGLIAPTAGCIYIAATTRLTMAELVSLFGALTLYLPALAGSVVGLITLTASTEPKSPAQGGTVTKITQTTVEPDADAAPPRTKAMWPG